MAATHDMKRNDLRPYFRVALKQTGADGVTGVVDLTNATSVKFSMKLASQLTGTPKISRAAATFIDRPNGIVQYQWVTGDTDTSGIFSAEVEVLWGSEPQSWPSTGYWIVNITDDVA